MQNRHILRAITFQKGNCRFEHCILSDDYAKSSISVSHLIKQKQGEGLGKAHELIFFLVVTCKKLHTLKRAGWPAISVSDWATENSLA